MIGTTLAHFEINAKLGEGGMGEVYRAEDTRLGREVAIKVLPQAVAEDPERLARFEREAKVLASLNHPHIAAIYQVEEAEGVHFLVMELAEGDDLAARLAAGAVSLENALRVAVQVAEALEAAHDKGIIHRDLKPANIKVGRDGEVKILDFGLAKALDPAAPDGQIDLASSPLSLSPTLTAQMTQAGVLLGTAGYMSPEQARGQAVDKRADIWAFGVVLYEMLAGKRLFDGDTVTDVLAAIVRADLDLAELPSAVPAGIRDLLDRCLDRDPKNRLRDIGEARIRIQRGLDSPEEAAPEMPTPSIASTGGPWKALAAVCATAAIGFGALWVFGDREPSQAKSQGKTVQAMALLTDLPGTQTAPSLSPDGNQLLFTSLGGADRDIFLLRVGGENALNLTADHEGLDDHATWSPDGQRIAFVSDRDGGGVFVMGATGESPLRVSDKGFHPTWSPDGTQLMYSDENITEIYSRMTNSVLTVVDVATGDKTIIPAQGDSVQGRWSPDGRWIAYWTADEGQRDIRTIAAANSEQFVSITDDPPADWAPFWSPDGTTLYFLSDRGGSPDLWRVAIDPDSGEVAGPLQAVTTGVADLMSASMAADGLRIAVGIEQRSSSIERYAFDPAAERLVGQPEVVFFSNNEVVQADLSNDEQTLAFRTMTPHDDIITVRVDGSERRRLTNDVARDRGPAWGPDDEWLFFYSNRLGSYEDFLIRSDGTGLRQLTGMPATDVNDVYVSNDGAQVAVVVFDQEGTAILDVDPSWLEADSSFEPLELETSTGHIIIGGFSPDDRYFVATTPPSGDDFAMGFLEIESDRFRPVTSPFGDRHSIWWDPAWIDERRLIFWERDLARAFIADAETGEAREVPGIPGPTGFEVADGGRTLYLIRRIEKADIWMLTLTDGNEDTNDR